MDIEERPALGKLSVGDKVIVIEPRWSRSLPADREIPATVVKVARVWATFRSDANVTFEWRMRIDVQREQRDHSYAYRFVTTDQLAWDKRWIEACNFLREQGIAVDFSSEWGRPAGRIRLAEIIRDGMKA